MKRILMLLVVSFLTMFSGTAQGNLLDDGSFENADRTAGGDTNSNWILTNDIIGVDANGALQFTSDFRKAPYATQDGVQGMWYRPQLGIGALAEASVMQTVVAPNSGDYELSFWAMHEAWNLESAIVSLSSSGTGATDSVDLYQEDLAGNFPAGTFHNGPGGGKQFFLALDGISAGDSLTVTSAMVGGTNPSGNTNAAQSWAVDNFVLNFTDSISVLAGDYNNNNIVDAADFTKWRDNLGAPAGTLPNDVDGNSIGQAQYNTWVTNFGSAASTSAVGLNSAVPEPASALLLMSIMASVAASWRCRLG